MSGQWPVNEVAFTRLLAEISSVGLTDRQYTAITQAMDLEKNEINEILERAKVEWDTTKEPYGEIGACVISRDTSTPHSVYTMHGERAVVVKDGWRVHLTKTDEGLGVDIFSEESEANGTAQGSTYVMDDEQ